MVLVAGVVWLVLVPEMERLESLLRMDVAELLGVVLVLITRLMIAVLALLAAIALIDYLYQRYEFMKQMRMTLQEVKDEFTQSDGDPQVRARLRQIRTERARQRMIQAVPTADVVVTNPTHFAVAMKYDESTMAAPLVVAKGADEVALRIANWPASIRFRWSKTRPWRGPCSTLSTSTRKSRRNITRQSPR